MINNLERDIIAAAQAIQAADGLVITAGAGMGVDSGLPDFRGAHGFWKAYPALGRAGLVFHEISNPAAFRQDPTLAWGFYGHRLDLYRRTVPHSGFTVLQRIARHLPHGAFVYTSNVDGQFQKAGFPAEALLECHGTVHRLQCLRPCCAELWSAELLQPAIDERTCRWRGDLPRCPHCNGPARPNVLMFYDSEWIDETYRSQAQQCRAWLGRVKAPTVIELGAGTAIPRVRDFGEGLDCRLIRINPGEPQVLNGVSVATGALAALTEIERALERDGFYG
jgi:NAD-dependent SIR2 family protein deacetylase